LKVLALCLAVLVSSMTFAQAAFEDEQWPLPNESAFGHHLVVIEDGHTNTTTYSLLNMYGPAGSYVCTSTSDQNCKDANAGFYRAFFPECKGASDADCVESLSVIDSNGIESDAQFSEYIYKNAHPNEYQGDGVLTPLHASDPSIWKIPNAKHEYGDEYLLLVSQTNTIVRGSDTGDQASFSINLFPISKKETPFTQEDVNGFANYPKCNQKIPSKGLPYISCGAGAHEFGSYRCAAKQIIGATCLMPHAFPENLRFKVRVRMSKEPANMLHGRMDNPEISIINSGKFSTITVTAGSIRVPILYSGGQYNSLPEDIKDYWDKCLSAGSCRYSTRQFSGNIISDPQQRNIQFYSDPFGETALSLIPVFSKSVKDTAIAAPSSWSIQTLPTSQLKGAASCFAKGSGFKGVVATNSTTYSEGPPKFEEGTLSYKVASLHYLPNGDVFKGRYDLILRSDVARCLYGFSSAPINATISVTSVDGNSQVATTVVNEKNNWLYLSAAGFTFSSPKIDIKLTQESKTPQAPKKYSISCIKGKSKKVVTAIVPKCPTGYKKVA
jgi:hypothetical protein